MKRSSFTIWPPAGSGGDGRNHPFARAGVAWAAVQARWSSSRYPAARAAVSTARIIDKSAGSTMVRGRSRVPASRRSTSRYARDQPERAPGTCGWP